MKAWIFLAIAIVFEITGTSLLKASDGFTRYWIGGLSMLCYWVSFFFLAAVLTKIPVGVAYAIWSGVGIAAVALIGWLVFKQTMSPAQIGFITLILIGAIGLNLTTPAEPKIVSESFSQKQKMESKAPSREIRLAPRR